MSKNDSGALTFDESNARITELLTGRTFDRFYRAGRKLTIVCTDNMEITLAADTNGIIHYLDHTVKVYVKGVGMGSTMGKLNNKPGG